MSNLVPEKNRLRAEQQQIELTMNPPPALPFVYADIGLTERVLENLIENAFTHTASGGRIRLDLRAEVEGVAIAVTDTGCGINPEDLPHIFDPFYQSARKRSSGEHAGLGLAIAKRIMTLQQGDLRVETTPDSGTRFIFLLPLAVVLMPGE